MDGKLKFDDFRIGKLPTMMYISDFITESEESYLLAKVNEAPSSKWKSLKNRRLQNWGGVVHEKGLLPQNLPPWLTKITRRISEDSGLFPSEINHVLINEYLPNQGIMPHQDGPAYFPVVGIVSLTSPVVMDFTPHARLLSSRSAGSNTDNQSPEPEIDSAKHHHPFQVLLMPRSLLIFKDEIYSDYLHGIKDKDEHEYNKAINYLQAFRSCDEGEKTDLKVIHRTETRVSLTCRLVSKVHKSLFKV